MINISLSRELRETPGGREDGLEPIEAGTRGRILAPARECKFLIDEGCLVSRLGVEASGHERERAIGGAPRGVVRGLLSRVSAKPWAAARTAANL